jgi:hypothetical protein
MKEAIDENNRLRIEHLGNRSANELTKREHIAALVLQGLLANSRNLYDNDEEIVDEVISITDLLIDKLNQNEDNVPLIRTIPNVI